MKHLSLKTARALRDAGWKQEGSAFYWHTLGNSWGPEEWDVVSAKDCRIVTAHSRWYACPTTDELLEALHPIVRDRGNLLELWGNNLWHGTADCDGVETTTDADTPAEALAALYLKLHGQEAKEAKP